MRQSAQQVDPTPLWKQEVNRRIAEHNGRKNAGGNELQAHAEPQLATGKRTALTAARVAARYAKAPSYSDMLAEEARAAVRAAESASRAAIEAQAAAESVLAGLEAASSESPSWEPEFFTTAVEQTVRTPAVELLSTARTAVQPSRQPAERQSFEIRWDADMPVREPGPALARASHGSTIVDTRAQERWDQTPGARSPLDAEGFEVVEPAQPIHANLIQFPRELVATRKIRPRRAEGPFAASFEAYGQLSIFEVDPLSISTEPPAASAAAEAGTATWAGPEWSGIELDEEPEVEIASPVEEPAGLEEAEPVAAAAAFEPASMNRRVMAAVVDFSLVAGAFLAAVQAALPHLKTLPSMKLMGFGSAVALAVIAVLYQAFFLAVARATPGMKYAQLRLSTFTGENPTRAQRCVRVPALLLSLLPVGLGVVWALFDEQHLCWHDRLSGTYLRRG